MKKILASLFMVIFIFVHIKAQNVKPETSPAAADVSLNADLTAEVSGDWQIVTFKENNVPVAEWIIDGGYIDKTGRQISGNVTVTGMVDDCEFKGILEFKNNEVVDGKYKFFFTENNYLHAEGKFINSMKEGYWEYFYKTGKKMANGDYSKNVRTGYWSFYNDKGIKEEGGWFKDGIKSRIHNTDKFEWLRKDIDAMKYKR